MRYSTSEDAKTFVETLWTEDNPEVAVNFDGTKYTIKVSQMYEYVPLNFALLSKLSEFFDTKNINDSRYHTDSCDTCDYESNYEITVIVAPDETPSVN